LGRPSSERKLRNSYLFRVGRVLVYEWQNKSSTPLTFLRSFCKPLPSTHASSIPIKASAAGPHTLSSISARKFLEKRQNNATDSSKPSRLSARMTGSRLGTRSAQKAGLLGLNRLSCCCNDTGKGHTFALSCLRSGYWNVPSRPFCQLLFHLLHCGLPLPFFV